MATVPIASIIPSGYITSVNQDGVKVVTDFKIIEMSFTHSPPIYKMEKECPHCNNDEFAYLVKGQTCTRCGSNVDVVVRLDNDDVEADIIESRFDILDL